MRTICVVGMVVVLAILIAQSGAGKPCIDAIANTAEAAVMRMESDAIRKHYAQIVADNRDENREWVRRLNQ